jgi:hypothetical protein
MSEIKHSFDDIIVNPKRSSKSSKHHNTSGTSLERDFIQLASEITEFFPEVLKHKDEFFIHITRYVKQGLNDWTKNTKT